MFYEKLGKGMLLAGLAAGCGDDDRSTGTDAAVPPDQGSASDLGASSDLGGVDPAYVSACQLLASCAPAYYELDTCIAELMAAEAELPTEECRAAYAAYIGCFYDVDCATFEDEEMLTNHRVNNCADELDATDTACPDA